MCTTLQLVDAHISLFRPDLHQYFLRRSVIFSVDFVGIHWITNVFVTVLSLTRHNIRQFEWTLAVLLSG